ncbi:hypothetical protein [Leptospira limi]|uniref:Uncharacterized protein n=1 Tax=Leptospira limi TaxID=2950023 RepID=A0ABT3M0D2_9LEPT|nr:hypothetical protein [Leptospira limi]MCW7463429.1 hypothetical protein [Leptospira limi]
MRKTFWEKFPVTILRIHGICLILLALVNASVSYRSTITENLGPFHFLYTNPTSEIGLWQAYLLMSLIGIVLIVGANGQSIWPSDLLGIAAHLVPLSTLALFKPLVVNAMGIETFHLSLCIHLLFITLEIFALVSGLLVTRTEGIKR